MKNYYTLLSELRIAETKLRCKEEQKQMYLNRITNCTSKLKDVVTSGNFSNDKMDNYLIKCETIDKEINELKEEVRILRSGLKSMEEIIKNISGIEERIFRLYFIENKTPTQISFIIPCDRTTVYRYINKIKSKYESCDKMQHIK